MNQFDPSTMPPGLENMVSDPMSPPFNMNLPFSNLTALSNLNSNTDAFGMEYSATTDDFNMSRKHSENSVVSLPGEGYEVMYCVLHSTNHTRTKL